MAFFSVKNFYKLFLTSLSFGVQYNNWNENKKANVEKATSSVPRLFSIYSQYEFNLQTKVIYLTD